jgi:hypothetical protein
MAVCVFFIFFDIPSEFNPRDHRPELLMMMVTVACICGGFIGQKSFAHGFFEDTYRSVFGSLLTVAIMALMALQSIGDMFVMIGLMAPSFLASAVLSVTLEKKLPAKTKRWDDFE